MVSRTKNGDWGARRRRHIKFIPLNRTAVAKPGITGTKFAEEPFLHRGIYAEGAECGAPAARQAADRLHLFLNLSVERALEEHRQELWLRDNLPEPGGSRSRSGGRWV